jgi:hypothetical protein
MVRVISDSVCFSFSVRIHQGNRKWVLRGIDAPVVTESQGPPQCRDIDRSPEIDDLEPLLQQAWSVLRGEVSVNTSDGRLCGLINVNAGDWLTVLRAVIYHPWTLSTDGYKF